MSKSTLSETDFQNTIIEVAELHRWLVYHTHDSRRSAPGFPDLTMVRDGMLIFAELKTEKGKLTEDQAQWIAELDNVRLRTGATRVFLWRPSDWKEIEEVLRREPECHSDIPRRLVVGRHKLIYDPLIVLVRQLAGDRMAAQKRDLQVLDELRHDPHVRLGAAHFAAGEHG